MLRSSCVYAYVFEGLATEDRIIMRLYPYVPQPFVIVTDLREPSEIKENDQWKFGLRLFGHAIDHFPYIVYSLMELGRSGLGREKIRFAVERITEFGSSEPLYEAGGNHLSKLRAPNIDLDCDTSWDRSITVDFLTPVRLRVGGKEVSSINFSDLTRAAIRRLNILTHFYGNEEYKNAYDAADLVEKSTAVKTKWDETHRFELCRFSTRQNRKMILDGLVGSMAFAGEMREFRHLLSLLPVTHLGKATSFGFGRISISE